MPDYYEFEVSLCDAPSRTWRRFLLAKRGTKFADLHDAIQAACGWEDYHLHLFRSELQGRVLAGSPFDDSFDEPISDSADMGLSGFFSSRGNKKCVYEYDFGDCWLLEVELHRVSRLQEAFTRRLLAGGRAFPPEDCGGIPGYLRISTVVLVGEDPWGENPAELKGWIGNWHPEAFSLEDLKARFDR